MHPETGTFAHMLETLRKRKQMYNVDIEDFK